MTGPALLTVLLAATAAGLTVSGGAVGVLRRRALVRGGPHRRWSLRGRRAGHDATALVVAGAVVLLGGAERALLGMTAGLVTRVLLRLVASHQARAQSALTRRAVVEVCDALAAELRAGQPPGRALHRVSAEHAVLSPAARAAALGGDVGHAFDQASAVPGAAGLRAVAAAWRVAERTGAGLASVLDRVAAALRAEQAAAAEVAASLGPPRATAQMLAVLPAFGLLLGSGLGGDPVGFLVDTLAGQVCLCLGCGLAVLGLWWVERLAAAVEERVR